MALAWIDKVNKGVAWRIVYHGIRYVRIANNRGETRLLTVEQVLTML